MREVNALKLRNNLGEILATLNKTGEPVIVHKGRKPQAVLITTEQFRNRFIDYQTEEKKKELLNRINSLSDHRIGDLDSVQVLRQLRGYET